MPLSFYNSCVHAGFPSPALDYLEERISMDELLIKHPLSTFLIRVDGESMKDACIPDKALLVVDKSLKAVHRSIIVAIVNGEFTVKRLVKTAKTWMLQPENALFKPIEITEDMQFEVWGVVTKIIIDAK